MAFVVSRRDLSPWVPLVGTVLVFNSGFWNSYIGFKVALRSGVPPLWLPWLGLGAVAAGLVLTGVSAATLGRKASIGDSAPQDPSPSFVADAGSRTDSLFAHRLDEMETRFDLAQSSGSAARLALGPDDLGYRDARRVEPSLNRR